MAGSSVCEQTEKYCNNWSLKAHGEAVSVRALRSESERKNKKHTHCWRLDCITNFQGPAYVIVLSCYMFHAGHRLQLYGTAAAINRSLRIDSISTSGRASKRTKTWRKRKKHTLNRTFGNLQAGHQRWRGNDSQNHGATQFRTSSAPLQCIYIFKVGLLLGLVCHHLPGGVGPQSDLMPDVGRCG